MVKVRQSINRYNLLKTLNLGSNEDKFKINSSLQYLN